MGPIRTPAEVRYSALLTSSCSFPCLPSLIVFLHVITCIGLYCRPCLQTVSNEFCWKANSIVSDIIWSSGWSKASLLNRDLFKCFAFDSVVNEYFNELVYYTWSFCTVTYCIVTTGFRIAMMFDCFMSFWNNCASYFLMYLPQFKRNSECIPSGSDGLPTLTSLRASVTSLVLNGRVHLVLFSAEAFQNSVS